jgi:alpha-L-arabinofuranosidase
MEGAPEIPATLSLDTTDPINTTALTTSLKVDIRVLPPRARAGVANEGFWGIPVKPNTSYRASFYAKGGSGLSGPLTVSIEDKSGKEAAAATVPAISGQWKKYEVTLRTGPFVKASTDNRFLITTKSTGTLNLNLVSLFPPTYNNRPNGTRIDLMEKLKRLNPSFLRFPGGNYLEGNTIAERFNWKESIGPLENRPGHPCPWGYRSSDGFGLMEFLEWSEDLKMEPVLGVFAGYALQGERVLGDALKPHVQDALDEIEYVMGDATTTWGRRRAADGHPAPFKLRYVEVGNEDFFDREPGSYEQRFAAFYDAIKAKYPELKVISSMPVTSRRPDVIDDHYYRSAVQMYQNVNQYDPERSPRTGPKIFVGEWATTEGSPTPTMNAALGDAAWLTGMERNSDHVIMSAYAPLLVNVNPGARQWATNLIGYDALNSYGSPAFYVQEMFHNNKGDTVLPVRVQAQPVPPPPPAPMPAGGIGVATWSTMAEYKDIKVTGPTGQTLYQSDFSRGTLDGWKKSQGDWTVVEGALRQTGNNTYCTIYTGDPAWTDYTVELKARKLGGQEGFMVMFDVKDQDNWLWWNIGGWTNTRTALERSIKGAKSQLGPESGVTVQNNRWYDLKVETRGRNIKCYLDGELVTEATNDAPPVAGGVFATASRVDATGEVIVKVVNADGIAQRLEVNLPGVSRVGSGTALLLAGDPDAVNSIEEPMKVAPRSVRLRNAGPRFVHAFPPHSVTVLRVNVER